MQIRIFGNLLFLRKKFWLSLHLRIQISLFTWAISAIFFWDGARIKFWKPAARMSNEYRSSMTGGLRFVKACLPGKNLVLEKHRKILARKVIISSATGMCVLKLSL